MMDKVVVDSSVAIKWFVVEPYSTEAHSILEEYQAGTLTLLAPDLLYAEVGNIEGMQATANSLRSCLAPAARRA